MPVSHLRARSTAFLGEMDGKRSEGEDFTGFSELEIAFGKIQCRLLKLEVESEIRARENIELRKLSGSGGRETDHSKTLAHQNESRLEELERTVMELAEEIKVMKARNAEEMREMKVENAEEIRLLREENENLKERLKERNNGLGDTTGSEEVKAEIKGAMREEMDSRGNAWSEKLRSVKEEMNVEFKEIMEQQKKEQMKEIKREVEREKSVIIFGVAETEVTDTRERLSLERNRVERIINELSEEEREKEAWKQGLDEIRRLGRYRRGGKRPLKVQFKTVTGASTILRQAWKLNKKPGYEDVKVKQDLSRKDREELRELTEKAKRRNDERTEEEKTNFFWRVDYRKKGIEKRVYARNEAQERGRRQDDTQ